MPHKNRRFQMVMVAYRAILLASTSFTPCSRLDLTAVPIATTFVEDPKGARSNVLHLQPQKTTFSP